MSDLISRAADTQFDALFNVVLDIMPRHDEDFTDHIGGMNERANNT